MILAGVFLILVGLLDVVFTVLHYDGYGFLSSHLYDKLFSAVRSLTRPLPRRYRALDGGPAHGAGHDNGLDLPRLLGLRPDLLRRHGGENVLFSGAGLEPSFMEALYFSGVSIATLGLGDVLISWKAPQP
jgi:hypothetical protein